MDLVDEDDAIGLELVEVGVERLPILQRRGVEVSIAELLVVIRDARPTVDLIIRPSIGASRPAEPVDGGAHLGRIEFGQGRLAEAG